MALLLFGCGEEAPVRVPAAPRTPEVVPQPPEPPPPPPGRAVWIDASGAVHETLAPSSSPTQVWATPAIAGLTRIHAVLPPDRVVAGAPSADESRGGRRHNFYILSRSADRVDVGAADRVFASSDGRFLVLEESREEFFGGGITVEHDLSAFDVRARSTRRIGGGSFVAFDERGRAIGITSTHDVGPNDAPRNHRTMLSAAPMPGETMGGPAPAHVPIVGPQRRVAYIDAPAPLSSGVCTLRIDTVEVNVRGLVCARIAPIAWAPDASAIAFTADERGQATLRVIAPDGRELGTYDAGAVDMDSYRDALGRIDFSPDSRELVVERPDGAIVRVSREGRVLAQLGMGSLRGYDHSGRYVLILGRGDAASARIVDTHDQRARDLGRSLDAAWLPP